MNENDRADRILDILRTKYSNSYAADYRDWGEKKMEEEYDYEEEITDLYKSAPDHMGDMNVSREVYEKMLTSVMEHLESVGGVEFAILKDHNLGKWWARKVKVREEKRKKAAAIEKLKSTMSKEELAILGIKLK